MHSTKSVRKQLAIWLNPLKKTWRLAVWLPLLMADCRQGPDLPSLKPAANPTPLHTIQPPTPPEDDTLLHQADPNAHARRMTLVKLLFYCDYERVGKHILDYLTEEESKQFQPIRTLRETCTEMGWGLLQKERVILQVSPDKLRDIQPYYYAGLYPHGQTPHCVCPIFQPIPADAVVRAQVSKVEKAS